MTNPFIVAAPEHTDHQLSGTFGECERMAYYSQVIGRQRREVSTSLDWGKTFHACADILETTRDIQAVEDFINKNLYEDPEDYYGRSRARMFEVLTKWVEWRQTNPIKVLRTEQPTVIRCQEGTPCPYYEEGCGLEYGGIMDRIVEWQGYLGPLDFKTTVMTNKDPANEFRLSHQLQGYVWIASHLLGNHCWGGIIERVITNKSKIEFGRFPIAYSRNLIREWVENEKVLQADFRYKLENHPDNEIAWRQNRGRCWEPYPCQYRDVCLSSREKGFRQRWLLDNTVERRWNFMKRDEEEQPKKELPLLFPGERA